MCVVGLPLQMLAKRTTVKGWR